MVDDTQWNHIDELAQAYQFSGNWLMGWVSSLIDRQVQNFKSKKETFTKMPTSLRELNPASNRPNKDIKPDPAMEGYWPTGPIRVIQSLQSPAKPMPGPHNLTRTPLSPPNPPSIPSACMATPDLSHASQTLCRLVRLELPPSSGVHSKISNILKFSLLFLAVWIVSFVLQD